MDDTNETAAPGGTGNGRDERQRRKLKLGHNYTANATASHLIGAEGMAA